MILVRLDVNSKIGTGHFRRSSILINSYYKKNAVFLIETDDEKNILFRNHNIFFTSTSDECVNIKRLIDEFNIKVIILDFLKYKKHYINKVKNITNLPIISFHEHEDYSKSSNLSINYNLLFNVKKNISHKILLGYKYIIFDDIIDKFKNLRKKQYIFVSFGGSDPTNFTKKFIENVATKMSSSSFVIHLGSFSHNHSFCKKSKNIKIINHTNLFFKYMSEAKKIIVAGGNMMYEAIYLGNKPLVVAHNSHQERFAKIANEKKLIKYIGRITNINFDMLINDININDTTINTSTSSIDNKGKKRIVREIEKLL